jgi:hypothetical protein
MKKIYIAGPMHGIKNFNFPAFEYAAKSLRMTGWEVFSPAERDIQEYGADIADSETGSAADAAAKGFKMRTAMAADMDWICHYADAIYMLKGWENSKGAQAEWALARALSLMVLYQ